MLQFDVTRMLKIRDKSYCIVRQMWRTEPALFLLPRPSHPHAFARARTPNLSPTLVSVVPVIVGVGYNGINGGNGLCTRVGNNQGTTRLHAGMEKKQVDDVTVARLVRGGHDPFQ